MDNFMTKLAEKISAQDIIRANSQAEAAEAARIKQEAEQYKAQLEEIRLASQEYKAILEEMKNDSVSYKAQLQDMKEDAKEYRQKLEDSETKIHDVGVQVYRNVQAVVEKAQDKNKAEFKELREKLETLQVTCETRNSAVLPLVVVILLVAGADLVLNILRLLGLL